MNMICFGILFMICEPAQPAPTAIVCPPIDSWSRQFQSDLLQDYDKLPENSAVRKALRQHIKLRDQIRACEKRKGK